MKTALCNIKKYASVDHEIHGCAIASMNDLNAPKTHFDSRKAFKRASQRGNGVLSGKRVLRLSR